jgi:signal transduction histidine kinase
MVASRRVPAWSVDAARRGSARLSLLWCLVALVGVPFALRSGWHPVAVAVGAGIAGCGVVAVQAFARRVGTRWALLMFAVLHVTTTLVGVAAARPFRPEAAHQIVSWINSGVGSALALTYGAWWGVAAFVLNLTASFVAESAAGGTLTGGVDSAIGPFTYVVGASLVRWAALRGEAATERALQAAQAAESALQVAEQRWDAARAVQRELHDTVLATLTMLAHRGAGVPREVVVRACARDAERLRRGDVLSPGTAPPGAAGQGAGPVQVGAPVPVGVVVPADVVRVADEVRATGFEVRVHVAAEVRVHVAADVRVSAADVRVSAAEVRVHVAAEGQGALPVHLAAEGQGALPVHLAAPVRDALRHALRECLENARRHSGVRAADVTVIVDDGRVSVIVVDEGRGFDPDAVPPDRLGLRDSVTGRLTDVGGSVTVWSGPGLGTCVLLGAPIAGDSGPARVGVP